MKAEVFFLKYAYPCAFIAQQRGEIDEKQMEELENAAVNEIALPREKLEKIFFRAFRRIETIAKELGKDRWDMDVLKEYFLVRHSGMVEDSFELGKDIPRTLKELCKIHIGEVVEKKNDVLKVRFNDKTRNVLGILVPNAKVGDRVTLHYGYAVEIVS